GEQESAGRARQCGRGFSPKVFGAGCRGDEDAEPGDTGQSNSARDAWPTSASDGVEERQKEGEREQGVDGVEDERRGGVRAGDVAESSGRGETNQREPGEVTESDVANWRWLFPPS